LVLGCDGVHSIVRKVIFPETWKNTTLPCRMLGLTVTYGPDAVREIQALDSFFLHGSDPEKGIYFWFSCTSPQSVSDA
jgi:2-polyprenyl-6-methoxyphenol hydroxylase-like FAD-dependent oxidoreductase